MENKESRGVVVVICLFFFLLWTLAVVSCVGISIGSLETWRAAIKQYPAFVSSFVFLPIAILLYAVLIVLEGWLVKRVVEYCNNAGLKWQGEEVAEIAARPASL
ncbi:MAG: hypothetical protein P4L62_00075 [Candidatus Pacebacteria bacterium]|nr:hypothetical protein [Candidatus Paceibacterota bacterium]MDR3582746.1 hypothetical protein [Candidatus Paceibacterota bacterium]